MAEQMRPASNELAPDPASSYERAKPEKESGMGRLDNNKAVPTDSPDQTEDAVKNKQDLRQINAEEGDDARHQHDARHARPLAAPEQPDHSMKDEEPMGSDQAPMDIHNPREQRHPKRDGLGGTP
jgi:hypothetical protein